MAKSTVPADIRASRLHLMRYLNDTWIYTEFLRPMLADKSHQLRDSLSKKKKKYKVPRRQEWLTSARSDREIGDLFRAQRDRGVFEANLVNIVSRVEAFIVECLTVVVLAHPHKIAVLGDKTGIPLDLFLANEDREALLSRYVEMRCQGLMFGKPIDYLTTFAKILGISLSKPTIDAYVEFKASRDIAVHGDGLANKIYLDKAGRLARARLGHKLAIDRTYLISVVKSAKALAVEVEEGAKKAFR